MVQNILPLSACLYFLLSFCLFSSAKPVDHAKHVGNAERIMAYLAAPIMKRDTMPLKLATLGQRHIATLVKRDGTWTIQAGDTGNGIAARLGISFEQLAFLNPGVEWQNLQIGQVLNIPCADGITGSRTYTVVAGDTGNAIAARNGITFETLSAFNANVVWNNLQIGQILVIPTPAAAGTQNSSPTFNVLPAVDNNVQASEPSEPLNSNAELQTTTPSPSELASKSSHQIGEPVQMTKDLNEKSPFLTPGPPEEALEIGNQTNTQVVKVRFVRNEQVYQPSPKIVPIPFPTPSPISTYTVKAGDIGYTIAAAYGIPFEDLSRANPGVVWTNLQIGQKLIIPIGIKASSLPASILPSLRPIRKPGQDVYSLYTGPASESAYPIMSAWLEFKTLWTLNLRNIGTNCMFFSGSVLGNSQQETLTLKNSIITAANETGVNPSFILAMVLQESNGCVRVPSTTSWEGTSNPGVLQSFNGAATCNNGTRIMLPCPDTVIQNMVNEGVKGVRNVGIVPALRQAAKMNGVIWPTPSIDGPKTMQAQEKRADDIMPNPLPGISLPKKLDEAMLYYQAARIYNSGSVPANGDLSGATGSTRCYVSDIVNRLMGWVVAPKRCSL